MTIALDHPIQVAKPFADNSMISLHRKSYLLYQASFVWIIFAFCGCAGYNVGNQFLHRSDIRTVHVSIVESSSFRQFQGQRLTEAIIKRISTDTPLTITEPALADSFLQARITRDRKRVLAENRGDEPRNLQVDWRLEVTWVDRAGVPLMQRQLLSINHDVNFIPEGGQSMATAQQELINRLAREIVGQMEMPW